MNISVDYSFKDNSGRLASISFNLHCLNVSLCNISAPNNHTDQLQFIRDLNNCLMDKTELTIPIVGGDWNCTLTKKDKKRWLPMETKEL